MSSSWTVWMPAELLWRHKTTNYVLFLLSFKRRGQGNGFGKWWNQFKMQRFIIFHHRYLLLVVNDVVNRSLIIETYNWVLGHKRLSGLQNKFSLSFPDLLELQSLKDRVYLSVDLLMLGRYQIVPTVIVLFIVFNLLPHCLNNSQLLLSFFVKEQMNERVMCAGEIFCSGK